MISSAASLLLGALLFISQEAAGYEQATHASITNSAVLRSELLGPGGEESSALIRTLGLETYRPLGNGDSYFEFIGSLTGISAYERRIQPYESKILDTLLPDWTTMPLRSWVLIGAIREDDNPSEDPPTPQDVEGGIRRPLHHFFDPYFNRPLTAAGLSLLDDDIQKNVDWALGVKDGFLDPNTPRSPRRNHFAIPDAREAMFRALTLKTVDGATYPDIASGLDPTTRQHWRQAYWATALRALGNVLHLNQDMAQPQHTRNEVHSGIACAKMVCPTGHTSVYEKYMNARALNAPSFDSLAPFHVPVLIKPEPLPLGAFPLPRFWRYTDYWSTAPGQGSLGGKGLADYSNRGFFSAANNLGANPYVAPSNVWTDYQVGAASPYGWDGSVSSDPQPVFILFGPVADTFTQRTDTHIPLTSFGMWDQFLKTKSLPSRYTLNRLNYDVMALLLLPRAASYSAGLIDFFFRGRIDISLPEQGVFALADHAKDTGFTQVRAKLKNATPSFVDAQGSIQPQSLSYGTLFAVVRYHTDKQYEASLEHVVGAPPCENATLVVNAAKLDASTDCRDGIEQIVVSSPVTGFSLASNGEMSFDFDFGASPIPFGITDVVLQVVYRGALGSEADAVAVGTVDVSEPTYFTYQNASDYIHIGEHVYTREQVDADTTLLAQVQPRSCVDYAQSPPHLVDGCLDTFPLDLSVSFTDAKKPIAKVEALPSRRLMRIAWLTVADEPINAAKMAARNVKVSVRRHDAEKALLYQDGTCLPVDPFDIPPRHAQMTVSPTQTGYRLDQLGTLRGVRGWYSTSCVWNGDAATPGAPDDRNSVMTPLDPKSDEIVPYTVAILPAAPLP